MGNEKKCPVTGRTSNSIAGGGTSNQDWWPNQLNLKMLHQHSQMSNPMGEAFNYPEEFKKLSKLSPQNIIDFLLTHNYQRPIFHSSARK